MTPAARTRQRRIPGMEDHAETQLIDVIDAAVVDLPAPRGLPGLTEEDARRVADALGAAQAANTVKNYRTGHRLFGEWCGSAG